MERHAGDARIRSRGPRPREDVGDGLADRRLVGEVEPYAADLRFVNDIGREDFGHRAQSLRQPGARGGGGFVGVADQERRCKWNGISLEQSRHLDRIKPRAVALHCISDDRARCGHVRLEVLRQAWRRRHQGVLRLPVAHQMHEPLDRFGFCLVARNTIGFEDWRDGSAGADPDGGDRLCPHRAVAIRPRRGGDRCGRQWRRGERGGNIHDKNGVVLRICDEALKRGDVAGRIGVAGDVDRVGMRPDRRQRRIQLQHGFRRNVGERAAEVDEPVDRQDSDPPAVREDRQPLAQERPEPPKCLGGGEQFVEIAHPQ